MWGFIFRCGARLKDRGERWKQDWLTRLGLHIREAAFKHGKVK
jgi:hypothetical protein